MPELREFLLSLPKIVVGAVIHRPGYFDRYSATYKDKLWEMNKTTFCILIERCAKFADLKSRQLEIFFEQAGKNEDRAIKSYMKELKADGNSFASETSTQYNPLTGEDYKRIVLGEPRERTKKTITIQIADLVLYPIAKSGYDPEYRPFQELKAAGLLIDNQVEEGRKSELGIKYSCFGK